MEMRKTKHLVFRVTPTEFHRVDNIARLTRRTRSDVMRLLIRYAEVAPGNIKAVQIPRAGQAASVEGERGQEGVDG